MNITLEREKLVTDNYNLIHHVLNKVLDLSFLKSQSLVDYEDLEQWGAIGLVKAAKGYDPSKGQFSTYACTAIRNEVLKELEKPQRELGKTTELTECIEVSSADNSQSRLEAENFITSIFAKMEKDKVKEIQLKKSMLLLLYGGTSIRQAAVSLGISKKKAETTVKYLRKYASLVRE